MKQTTRKLTQLLTLVLLYSAGVLAHAGGAVIAHPSNPVAGLSKDQVTKIYLGKTKQFPNGKDVEPVDQAAGSKMRQRFHSKILEKSESQVKMYWSKLLFTGKAQPPKELSDDKAVKEWVANNPNGLGYVDAKVLDRSVKGLLVIP